MLWRDFQNFLTVQGCVAGQHSLLCLRLLSAQIAKNTYKREATKYKKSENLSKERRKQLKQGALEAKQAYVAARQKLERFPAKLEFINFPIPDEYILSDELVEGLCREVESKLRAGKVSLPVP